MTHGRARHAVHALPIALLATLGLLLGSGLTNQAQGSPGPRLVASRPAPSVPVVRGSEVVVLFQEDFESGMGAWTVIDESSAGAQWGDWGCWAAGGAASAGCAAAGTAPIGCAEDYPPGLKTWMIHGPFSLDPGSDFAWAECTFDYTLDTEVGFDRLVVASSVDGVRFTGDEFEGVATGSATFDLTPRKGEAQVWLGFLFTSDISSGRPIGASIDNVLVQRDSIPTFPSVATRAAWTLSDRDDSPVSGFGSTGQGFRSLYLWYACDDPALGGVEAMEAELVTSSNVFLTSYTPIAPSNNFGALPTLQLGIACAGAPLLVGELGLFVTNGAHFEVCLGPTVNFTDVVTVNCDTGTRASDVAGYYTAPGPHPCVSDSLCDESTTAVETMTWGELKSRYRR